MPRDCQCVHAPWITGLGLPGLQVRCREISFRRPGNPKSGSIREDWSLRRVSNLLFLVEHPLRFSERVSIPSSPPPPAAQPIVRRVASDAVGLHEAGIPFPPPPAPGSP